MCGKLLGHREECCGVVVLVFGVLYWVMHNSHRCTDTRACTDTDTYTNICMSIHVCTFPQAYSLSQNEAFFFLGMHVCMCACARTYIHMRTRARVCVCVCVCVCYGTGGLLALKIKWEFSFTCLQRNCLGFLLRASVRAVQLTCVRRYKWTTVLLRFVMRKMIRLYSS